MARRFSRIERQKFLDTLYNLGPFTLTDERVSLDIHLEYLKNRSIKHKEEQFNALKENWEKYLNKHPKDWYDPFNAIKEHWERNYIEHKKRWEEHLITLMMINIWSIFPEEKYFYYSNDEIYNINWSAHRGNKPIPFRSADRPELKPYIFDPQLEMSQPRWFINPDTPHKLRFHPSDIIRAADNISKQVDLGKIITGICSKLQGDIEIIADYFSLVNMRLYLLPLQSPTLIICIINVQVSPH